MDAAAIAQCVLQELRWDFKQLDSFLEFEAKQTTDPHRLRNPPGHYRRVAQQFQQAAASRREYSSRQKQLLLEAQLREQHERAAERRSTCPLSLAATATASTGPNRASWRLASARQAKSCLRESWKLSLS